MSTIGSSWAVALVLPGFLFACRQAVTEQPGQPSPRISQGEVNWCDSGSFTVRARGRVVGHEEFKVDCQNMSNILVRVHSSMRQAPANGEVHISLSLDSLLRPKHVDVAGVFAGVRVADTLDWRGDSVVVSRGGHRTAVATAPGSSFVGVNFHTGVWLATARYDLQRRGRQLIPVFPKLTMTAELEEGPGHQPRVGDAPMDAGIRSLRLEIGGQLIIAWVNGAGRVVALVYPSQGLEAIRDDANLKRDVAIFRARSGGMDTSRTHSGSSLVASVEELRITTGAVTLAGTLTLPKRQPPHPAVVLISGSGPQDRDGRLAMPGLERYRPFRDIAQALAIRGLAVLRLDDRGVGGSNAGSQPITTATAVQDVKASIAALRARSDVDPKRIGLLGHSEGALVAMMVAAEDTALAAIALLGAPAVRGDTLLGYQLEEQLAEMPHRSAVWKDSLRLAQQQLFDSVRSRRSSDDSSEWLRVYLALEPVNYAKRVRCPVLIVHGSRDRQVRPSSAEVLAESFRSRREADVTTGQLEGLNHLFLPAKTGRVSEYPHIVVQTLGPGLLNLLGSWFVSRLRSTAAAAVVEQTTK